MITHFPITSPLCISETFRKEACDSDTLELQCPHGSELAILEANYGRTDCSVCSEGRSETELDSHDCRCTGAVAAIRGECEGKQQCSLTVDVDTLNSGIDPCVGIAKYAEVQYQCKSMYI